MKKLIPLVTLAFAILLSSSILPVNLSYKIVWEDDFNSQEKHKVRIWLDGVSEVVAKNLGKYPFEVTYYIHKRPANEPVPWAHTTRGANQGVHFHISPDFGLQDFQMDWTAPHEISHLSIPFVGRENMWFSEGYASFMQWHLLEMQGMYSEKEILEKYQSKLDMIKDEYDSDLRFLKVSDNHKKRYNFPALYWGGACFFIQADSQLRRKYQTNLFEVIMKYQFDGRMQDEDLEDLIASLDRVSKTDVFSQLFKKFNSNSAKSCVQSTELKVK